MQPTILDAFLLVFWTYQRAKRVDRLNGLGAEEFKRAYLGYGLLRDLMLILFIHFCFDFVPDTLTNVLIHH